VFRTCVCVLLACGYTVTACPTPETEAGPEEDGLRGAETLLCLHGSWSVDPVPSHVERAATRELRGAATRELRGAAIPRTAKGGNPRNANARSAALFVVTISFVQDVVVVLSVLPDFVVQPVSFICVQNPLKSESVNDFVMLCKIRNRIQNPMDL
jgi:hypothetical protein